MRFYQCERVTTLNIGCEKEKGRLLMSESRPGTHTKALGLNTNINARQGHSVTVMDPNKNKTTLQGYVNTDDTTEHNTPSSPS